MTQTIQQFVKEASNGDTSLAVEKLCRALDIIERQVELLEDARIMFKIMATRQQCDQSFDNYSWRQNQAIEILQDPRWEELK